MKRRHSMMAFLLTGCLGWQSPEPAWAVGGAASAPKPNSISSQAAPQSTSLWRLAQATQPTLADAEDMVRGVPLGPEEVSRLPKTLFNTEEGTLAVAMGSATQITLPLRYTGSYQVMVISQMPEHTGRYRLGWDTPSDGPAASAFTYQGGHSPMPAFGPENSLDGLFTLSLPFADAEIARMRAEFWDSTPDLIEALLFFGITYGMQERWADAEKTYAEVLAIVRAMPNPNPRYLAWVLENVGLMAEQMGDLAQAEALYQEGLALQRAALENLVPQGQDDVWMAQRSMTFSLVQLAKVYQQQQRYDEAEPLIAEALELADGLPESIDRMYYIELAAEASRAQGRGGTGEKGEIRSQVGPPRKARLGRMGLWPL